MLMTRSFKHGGNVYRILIGAAERHNTYDYEADVMLVDGRELRTASLYQISEQNNSYVCYLRGRAIGTVDRFSSAVDLIQDNFKARHALLR